MADRYSALVSSGIGKQVATALGLPRPSRLRRHEVGAAVMPGAVLVAGAADSPLAECIRELLGGWDVAVATQPSTSVAGVVLDMTGIMTPGVLEQLRFALAPALKTLQPSGRVVVLGRPPTMASTPEQAAARQALEGIVRSVAKEMRGGGTANLVRVAESADANIAATLRFFLSGRSAYVSGQVVEVGAGRPGGEVSAPADWDAPLAGKVAVVTGAARGIGAEIARVLSRDRASVVCVDIPAAGAPLAALANEIGGSALQLDVTTPDAGDRIADHARSRHGGLDIVVHNAGITRDKLLANTDADRWHEVLDVNLLSVLRMNEALLDEDGIADDGHLVLVSSIAGLAGNRGQANYAASKAGIAGLTRALGASPELHGRGITVNAVAPGFIETEMTAKIPFATREVGRRLNSLAQGGLPVDVAETIGWLSWDANAGVTGQVVRVCGQSLLGA
ncbi:MAG: 3-oxoacyl-ACP reductase [Tetrasphaera sp.]